MLVALLLSSILFHLSLSALTKEEKDLRLVRPIIWGSTNYGSNYSQEARFRAASGNYVKEDRLRIENSRDPNNGVWITLNLHRIGAGALFAKGNQQQVGALVLGPSAEDGTREMARLTAGEAFTLQNDNIVLLGVTPDIQMDIFACLQAMALQVEQSLLVEDISMAQLASCSGCTVAFALVIEVTDRDMPSNVKAEYLEVAPDDPSDHGTATKRTRRPSREKSRQNQITDINYEFQPPILSPVYLPYNRRKRRPYDTEWVSFPRSLRETPRRIAPKPSSAPDTCTSDVAVSPRGDPSVIADHGDTSGPLMSLSSMTGQDSDDCKVFIHLESDHEGLPWTTEDLSREISFNLQK